MESNQQDSQSQEEQQGHSSSDVPGRVGAQNEKDAVAVPFVVRTSTPRPLSHEEKSIQEPEEFVWLFEYGLEMDIRVLNQAERLNGLALAYGPAVLKGYRLLFGKSPSTKQTLVTIAPSHEPEAAVWGMLYRIPRHVALPATHGNSLLDTLHKGTKGAKDAKETTSESLYQQTHVIVHEIRRKRDVSCITYSIPDTAQQRFSALSAQQIKIDPFVQQLVALAEKQQFPEEYVQRWGAALHGGIVEQDTEPLPVVTEKQHLMSTRGVSGAVRRVPISYPGRWLIAFALYLSLLLLAVLTLLVLQSMGYLTLFLLTPSPTMTIPLSVLVYGLLGGCISSLISLARSQPHTPPHFVIVTWFMRPYIGAVLALFVYLLLTSGFLAVNVGNGRHGAFYLFISALAGGCECWLFSRR